MKEEQDVVSTDQPQEESKLSRYARIVLVIFFLSILVVTVVMAALRRYGS